MKIYDKQGDKDKAAAVAKRITAKPVKVPSGTVNMIVDYAKAYLQNSNTLNENLPAQSQSTE